MATQGMLPRASELQLIVTWLLNPILMSLPWSRPALSLSTSVVLTAIYSYRGFGHSTGAPTETGLIVDGVALVSWIVSVCNIPPERIVIYGHSLGTAVSAAVARK